MPQWSSLSSAEKPAAVSRAASQDLTPAYVDILRQLPEGMRLHQAFSLWRMAKDALYRQELARGLSPEAAMQAAAQRMLQIRHDSTA